MSKPFKISDPLYFKSFYLTEPENILTDTIPLLKYLSDFTDGIVEIEAINQLASLDEGYFNRGFISIQEATDEVALRVSDVLEVAPDTGTGTGTGTGTDPTGLSDPLDVINLFIDILNVSNQLNVSSSIIMTSTGIEVNNGDLIIQVDNTFHTVIDTNLDIDAGLVFYNTAEIYSRDPVITLGLKPTMTYTTNNRGIEFLHSSNIGFMGFDVERNRFVFYYECNKVSDNKFERLLNPNKVDFDIDTLYTSEIINADYENWNSVGGITNLIINSSEEIIINSTKSIIDNTTQSRTDTITNNNIVNAVNETWTITTLILNANTINFTTTSTHTVTGNNLNFTFNEIQFSTANNSFVLQNNGVILPTNLILGNSSNLFSEISTQNLYIGNYLINNNDITYNQDINIVSPTTFNGLINMTDLITIGDEITINSTSHSILRKTKINTDYIVLDPTLIKFGINTDNTDPYNFDVNGNMNILGDLTTQTLIIGDNISDTVLVNSDEVFTGNLNINDILFFEPLKIGIGTSVMTNETVTISTDFNISSTTTFNKNIEFDTSNLTLNSSTMTMNNDLNINNLVNFDTSGFMTINTPRIGSNMLSVIGNVDMNDVEFNEIEIGNLTSELTLNNEVTINNLLLNNYLGINDSVDLGGSCDSVLNINNDDDYFFVDSIINSESFNNRYTQKIITTTDSTKTELCRFNTSNYVNIIVIILIDITNINKQIVNKYWFTYNNITKIGQNQCIIMGDESVSFTTEINTDIIMNVHGIDNETIIWHGFIESQII